MEEWETGRCAQFTVKVRWMCVRGCLRDDPAFVRIAALTVEKTAIRKFSYLSKLPDKLSAHQLRHDSFPILNTVKLMTLGMNFSQ